MKRTYGVLLVILASLAWVPAWADEDPPDPSRCADKFKIDDSSKLSLRLTRTVRVRERSDCIRLANGSLSSYELLRLPEFKGPYYITVTSTIGRKELFSPLVVSLDGKGKPVRWIKPEKMYFRGDRLIGTLFFNPKNKDERFLALMSNPGKAGSETDRLVQGSGSTGAVGGLLGFGWTWGKDKRMGVELTRYGNLTVSGAKDPYLR